MDVNKTNQIQSKGIVGKTQKKEKESSKVS